MKVILALFLIASIDWSPNFVSCVPNIAVWPSRPDHEVTLPGFLSFTWPNGVVPYEIDPQMPNVTKRRILMVFDVLMKTNQVETCVTFREKTSLDSNFLYFQYHDQYCYSQYVGFASIGKQFIYLSDNCANPRFVYWTTLQTLGLPSEHMRPDRDQHIEINWDALDTRFVNSLKKYEFIDDRILKLGYDTRSRLHYNNMVGSADGNTETIRYKGDPYRDLGNPVRPTQIDLKKLAAIYCSTPPTTPAPNGTTTPSPNPLPRPLPPLGTVPSIASMSSMTCQCLETPVNGSCEDENLFQWRYMSQLCLNSTTSSLPVCTCESDFLTNVSPPLYSS